MDSLGVPIIDISSLVNNKNDHGEGIKANIRKISDACEQWGFFYIVNHGVDIKFIEKTIELGLKFFKMPKDFKKKVARREVRI